MNAPGKPYFYLKAKGSGAEIIRNASPGGQAALCYNLPDGSWFELTLELTGDGKNVVVTSHTTNTLPLVLATIQTPTA